MILNLPATVTRRVDGAWRKGGDGVAHGACHAGEPRVAGDLALDPGGCAGVAITAPGTGPLGYADTAAGQRQGLSYPDGTSVGYACWPDGQLKAVTQGGATLAGYAYDGAGRLQTATRADGAVTPYSYDGADRLRDLSTRVGGALRSRFTSGVDRLGQQTAVTETLPLSAATSASGNGATLFGDGFEGGSFGAWTTVQSGGRRPRRGGHDHGHDGRVRG